MWVVVPCLNELKDQLNDRFPNRDKTTDGTIGDKPHAESTSSHNPDLTGTPEFRDGDAIDEVRARDVDKDLNDAGGVVFEDLVQLVIKDARNGKHPYLRYLVYNGRIWHKRDNYVTRVYTGSNQHTDHGHFNSDFTQEADTVTGTDWGFSQLGGTPSTTPPATDKPLKIDDQLGPLTIAKWQKVMGTPVDGFISKPTSKLVAAVQRKLKSTVDSTLVVDGNGIFQDGKRYKTVFALQRYLKAPVDGFLTVGMSETIKQLQRRLNEGWF